LKLGRQTGPGGATAMLHLAGPALLTVVAGLISIDVAIRWTEHAGGR